jgi:hypothetical protein
MDDYMFLDGYARLGCLWMFMDVYGCLWMFMVIMDDLELWMFMGDFWVYGSMF